MSAASVSYGKCSEDKEGEMNKGGQKDYNSL